MDDCVLLVGLGNPGSEYQDNRHNLGFMIVDAIAEAVAENSFRRMSDLVEISSFFFNNQKVILAKPQTFMNLSGRAVRFLIDFFKIPLDKIRVFHDDLDLPCSKLRIKKGGGNGGHNGLKSIDNLAGNDYWRIRFGIGRPPEKSMIVSYVLHDVSKEEMEKISQISQKIIKNMQTLLSDDVKKLENLINS